MSLAASMPPLFQGVVDPIRAFLRREATGGILLFVAAVAAMAWANSPWRASYFALFQVPVVVDIGGFGARFTLAQLINDGLMAIFFFVVGMEIKRELVLGELRTVGRALLPGVAALGGMVVPALIYLAFNRAGPGRAGWAIPMATDIAFCIGCLTLLKGRVSHGLVVFLTALAIFDDMGGILVIALFYGHGLAPVWLAAAGAVALATWGLARLHLRSGIAYAIAGAALWLLVHHGGIHATVAGVILGLLIPAREATPAQLVIERLHAYTASLKDRATTEDVANEEVLQIEERLEELEPPLNRFVHLLHPWVALLIMPVFALANSGIDLSGVGAGDLREPVLLGAAFGLFFGKQLGIFAFAWAAARLGRLPLPGGAGSAQLYGVAMVGGIGFTVALFIANLAFAGQPALLDQAKLGIVLGSLAAGVLGWLVLRLAPAARVG